MDNNNPPSSSSSSTFSSSTSVVVVPTNVPHNGTTDDNNVNNRKESDSIVQHQSTPNQKWFPLESNPILMNQYIHTLGWDIQQYSFMDVFSTETWALDMIPSPCLAVLLLYPLTDVQIQHETIERIEILQQQANNNATSTTINDANDNNVWFIQQRIGNACGTIGLLHAMMNAVQQQQQQQGSSSSSSKTTTTLPPFIQPNSWLDTFYKSTFSHDNKTTTPIQRAEILENDPIIATLHDHATSSIANQTSRGNSVDDDIITHFIAFVVGSNSSNSTTTTTTTSNNNNNGSDESTYLYELDGRKVQPIPHGKTTNTTLLQDACTVIREQFMARDPHELRFTILALAPTPKNE